MKKLSQNAFFLTITAFFCISHAWAQGNSQSQTNYIGLPCVTTNKGYIVHFTAYQPAAVTMEKEKEKEGEVRSAFQRFCHDLPITGVTYITIDLVDQYTRNRPVALRIVEAEEGEEPDSITEIRTLIEVPEKKYRTGLVEAQVTFDQKGLYAAILTIGGEDLTIPVRVGIEKKIPLSRRVSNIVLGVLILSILGYVLYHFRSKILAKIKNKKA